jgi:hypothetical protein
MNQGCFQKYSMVHNYLPNNTSRQPRWKSNQYTLSNDWYQLRHLHWANASDELIRNNRPTLEPQAVIAFKKLCQYCAIALSTDFVFLEKVSSAGITAQHVISHVIAMGKTYFDAVFNNRDIIYYLIDNHECQECCV